MKCLKRALKLGDPPRIFKMCHFRTCHQTQVTQIILNIYVKIYHIYYNIVIIIYY